MTTALLKFTPQPDIQELFNWREQLSGSLKYGGGQAAIEFDVEVSDDTFSGETRDSWAEWCEAEVHAWIQEYAPTLWDMFDGQKVKLEIDAEDAPDDVQEQEDCDRWARAAGLRYGGGR